jgi:hypothetical protein
MCCQLMSTIHRRKYDCHRSRVTTNHCRQTHTEISLPLMLLLLLLLRLLLLLLLILSRGCWR